MTTIRPALGTAFTYFADVTLLVQETGKLFGQVDEEERERVRKQPGLRAVVEVLKSRVSVSVVVPPQNATDVLPPNDPTI
jgi:DNA repair protein RAD51